MNKDFKSGSDMKLDTVNDNGSDIGSDLGGDLAGNDGVDLNTADISKTDSIKRHSAKADIMYYVPPPPPEVPAEVRVIDSSLMPSMEFTQSEEESNSNYWEDRANNLNDYLEELGGATSQMLEDKNTRAENDETATALNDTMLADNCDPPETELADQESDISLDDLNSKFK